MPDADFAAELYTALDVAYDALNDAYWAASTIEAKDQIKGASDVLDDLLTNLNAATFDSRAALLSALGNKLKTANTSLQKVKAQIDQIVHAVDVATSVASAVDKAATEIAKFFV